MRPANWSRRGFLNASTASLMAAGLPAWFARESVAAGDESDAKKAKYAANDQIVMGAIGVGGMGSGDMNNARRRAGVKMVAVCDVYEPNAKKAAEQVGPDTAIYKDYRELLARDDIDAVTIGTPDHWHTLIALEAIRRGKDVYCEKPLTLTIDEGKHLVKAAREKGTIFQVGSQQRSDDRFRLACELVRNGRLGKIKTIEARIGRNPVGGPFKEGPILEGLDWDFWLGQTPEVAYIKERCLYEFRWWRAYSGGKMTDWGAHHNDIAQWALGKDGSGPISVNAVGSAWPVLPNSYDMPERFVASCTYDNGTVLKTVSDGENGVHFDGENGWIFVSRSTIQASDPKLLEEPLGPDATRLYVSKDHMQNWIDGIRTRTRPICDVEIGHRSVSVCHMENIALNLRRELKWNPETEMFDDDEANALLKREMRSPWSLG